MNIHYKQRIVLKIEPMYTYKSTKINYTISHISLDKYL